jgi:K(+)-stimulated pyrophosphate-energized sodium pump
MKQPLGSCESRTLRWSKFSVIAAALLPLSGNVCFAEETSGAVSPFLGGGLPLLWIIAPIGAILGLIFARVFFKQMMEADEGTEKMRSIAQHVRDGAMAYLSRQYKAVAAVFVILLIVFSVMAKYDLMQPLAPIMFVVGGFFSALSGWIGMRSATLASARTTNSARESLNGGLQVAFRSGAVMGLTVVGFGLLNLAVWYLLLLLIYSNNWFGLGAGMDQAEMFQVIAQTMLTFGIGASTVALFARVGGGIYTKAADVGADLVGKVEAGIPEDDPRNPATIADNVGDNVGDVAGMGADLYESYVGSILATLALGTSLFAITRGTTLYIVAPMIVAGIGIILSILGVFGVRCKEEATQKNLLHALLMGTLGSTILVAIAVGLFVGLTELPWGIFGAVITGLVVGFIIGQSTEWFTADEYRWTKGVARQCEMGAAPAIIEGIAIGMLSSAIPVIMVVGGILVAFGLSGGFADLTSGLYGVGFAAVGMLSTLGITLATDAYGPVADNAGGNAEMSGLPPEVRERTDALDALGNTTAATGKGFAIGSAALTAMALLAAYVAQIPAYQENINTIEDAIYACELNLLNPMLLGGLFIGAMMAFVFCGLTMRAVGRSAGEMVAETRRQFKKIRGKLVGDGMSEEEAMNPDNWPDQAEIDGETIPNYNKCVTIATKGAQKEMILPSLLAIIVPVAVGLVLGVAGVLGLLAGSLVTGLSLACLLNNSGGSWDNAKKWIEKGNLGGKGSETHKAGVVGDTVGDPFKDTSGPSLNILIKLMSMVSITFAGLVITVSPAVQKLLHLGGN